MRLRVLCLLAAFAALVPTALAAPKPTLPLQPCDIAGSSEKLLCATFIVPENRAIQGGRTLPLRVVVIPARAHPAKEPIFVLSGGPGQAATAGVGEIAGSWLRQDHDVVVLDMRGTGEGTRLDCDLGGSDSNLQEYLEPIFHEGARYGECAAVLARKADLTQYTTPIAMRDMDDLRQALGYDKIDLYGGSYGTRAGIVYIHMFGAHVHAAALSGLSPIANRAPLYHAAAAQRAFDRIVTQCEAEAPCRAAYPHLQADLAAILASLRQKPARATVKHPVTNAPVEVSISASGFADGLRVMLYSEESGRRVPLLLQRARAGDFTPFAEMAMQSSRGFKNGLRMGLLLSVSCAEDVARIRPEEVARETAGKFIGDYRVRGQMAACAVWPKGTLPADFTAPFRSDVPVLLISGDLDPVTPPQWGEEAQRSFPHSLHVVMPGAHVGDNPCVDALARKLFDTGTVDGLDTACVASVHNPPFVLPPG